MGTLSALLALWAGNSPVTGEFPAQGPVTRSSMFCLICAWIKGWVNNRKANDLRYHRAHYDVVVIIRSSTHFTCRHLGHWWQHLNVFLGCDYTTMLNTCPWKTYPRLSVWKNPFDWKTTPRMSVPLLYDKFNETFPCVAHKCRTLL